MPIMMPSEKFLTQVRSHLEKEGLLQCNGAVLYSALETVRPGAVYLLGFNPGGAADTSGTTIADSLERLKVSNENAYIDEAWTNASSKGNAPLQRRVRRLLETIGLNPRDVCASNLVFVRSRSERDLSHASNGYTGEKLKEICWEVHQWILEIVRPKTIIAFGNGSGSPYQWLRKEFEKERESEVEFRAGHGNWMCRTFRVPHKFQVIGLPHLSRYDITRHPEVLQEICALLNSR